MAWGKGEVSTFENDASTRTGNADPTRRHRIVKEPPDAGSGPRSYCGAIACIRDRGTEMVPQIRTAHDEGRSLGPTFRADQKCFEIFRIIEKCMLRLAIGVFTSNRACFLVAGRGLDHHVIGLVMADDGVLRWDLSGCGSLTVGRKSHLEAQATGLTLHVLSEGIRIAIVYIRLSGSRLADVIGQALMTCINLKGKTCLAVQASKEYEMGHRVGSEEQKPAPARWDRM